MSDVLSGICKWFDGAKGFGFISALGKDYFVHFRNIDGAETFKKLEQNDKVEFTPEVSQKGWVATKVKKVK